MFIIVLRNAVSEGQCPWYKGKTEQEDNREKRGGLWPKNKKEAESKRDKNHLTFQFY